MIKAKWLNCELPISLHQLAKLMKGYQYTDNSGNGFLLSTATGTKLVGRYIEKIIKKTVIEDPFGQSSEVESISYYVCYFDWRADSNYMYVIDPPRSLRKFINALHDLTGLGLVMSELNVSPKLWLELIESDAMSVKILQISTYGIKVSKDAIAKIIVTGKSDVKPAFLDIMPNKKYLIDSVKFTADFDDLSVVGELTKSGMCRLQSANRDFILEKLRSALSKLNSIGEK